MTGFLRSLKADLLDRRLLPLVGLAAAALVGALAYVLLSGGSSSAPTPVASATPVVATHGSLAVVQVKTSSTQAVAETTDGASHQRQGKAHNPFTPLPSKVAKTAKAPASSSSSSSAPSGGGSSSSSTSKTTTTTTTTTTTKSSPPATPKATYDVSVLFGVLPPGSTPATVTLTSYENLKLQAPLPAKSPLVIFRGTAKGGKTATFTIYGEVILHGNAVCLPSSSLCQAIELAPGQSEQFEYLTPEGTLGTYELRVVSITPAKATTARVSDVHGGQLLRSAGLLALPGMHYADSASGVLVLDGHSPFAAHSSARAKTSRRGR